MLHCSILERLRIFKQNEKKYSVQSFIRKMKRQHHHNNNVIFTITIKELADLICSLLPEKIMKIIIFSTSNVLVLMSIQAIFLSYFSCIAPPHIQRAHTKIPDNNNKNINRNYAFPKSIIYALLLK